MIFSSENKKQKLLGRISEIEEKGDKETLVRALMELGKLSSIEELGNLYLKIADNIKTLYNNNNKTFSIELAAEYYIKSLTYSSDKLNIYNNIIFCYFQTPKNDKVIEFLIKSLNEFPDQGSLYSSLFDLGLSDFSFEDRKNFLNEMLNKFPNSAFPHFYRGKELRFNDKIKSLFHLKRAIELNPLEEDFYGELIDLLRSEMYYDDCIKYINLLLANFPNSSSAYKTAAKFYNVRAKFYSPQKSIEYLLKSITLNQKSYSLHSDLAAIYSEIYDFKEAIKHYELALSLMPSIYESDDIYYDKDYKSSQIFFSLAVLYNLTSDSVSSFNYYQKAVKKNQKYLDESFLIVVYDYKIIRMKNILAKNPNNKFVLYSLASRFYEFKNYEQAFNYFGMLAFIDINYKDVRTKFDEVTTKYVDGTYSDFTPLNDYLVGNQDDFLI